MIDGVAAGTAVLAPGVTGAVACGGEAPASGMPPTPTISEIGALAVNTGAAGVSGGELFRELSKRAVNVFDTDEQQTNVGKHATTAMRRIVVPRPAITPQIQVQVRLIICPGY